MTDRAEVAEQLRLAVGSCGRHGRAERNIRERRDRVDQMLRRLRDDVVVDARLRIEPEVRLQQGRARQRREHARRDLLLRDSEFERLVAIDVDVEGRVVLRLRDPQIADPRNHLHAILQSQRDIVVGLQIVAVDLRVDRSRQAEIEHLADDVGGLKVGRDVRKLALDQFADLLLVDGGRLMLRASTGSAGRRPAGRSNRCDRTRGCTRSAARCCR